MNRNTQNIVPVTAAVLLHAALAASMLVVFDFDRTPDFAMPLAIEATLVTENAVVIPPKVETPPKVEEAPKVEKAPPPEPDTAAQERLAAEKAQREKDAAEERARLQKIEDDKAEAERKRKEAEQKRKEAEAEEERRRQEAEKKRLEDIERQRLENEQARIAAEDAARKAALEEESQVLESMAASAKSAYIFKIKQAISRNWVIPKSGEEGLQCIVNVQQTAGGVVLNVSFGQCNGDATVRRSIQLAVEKASPLPAPRDPSVFDRNLSINFST